MIRYLRPRRKRDSTIPLINVVFLMLVFFLVAGSVAQPLDPNLNLVKTADLDQSSPPDAIVVGPDGALSYLGEPVGDADAFLARPDQSETTVVRIVPDRDLPAAKLVELGASLRAAGAERVLIVTERGLE